MLVSLIGLMMELSTMGVGCLCQGSLSVLDHNMAAPEDLPAMVDHLPMVCTLRMEVCLVMVNNHPPLKASMGIAASLATAVWAMEVKEADMDSLDMDLDL